MMGIVSDYVSDFEERDETEAFFSFKNFRAFLAFPVCNLILSSFY